MRASETMEGTLDLARCGTLLEVLGIYAEGETGGACWIWVW